MKKNLGIIATLIIVGATSRLIPHWPNFTPVVALALFAGVYLRDKWLAVLVPLVTMLITDVILDVYASMLFTYIPLVIITLMGTSIRKPGFGNIIGASLLGSVIFFALSNFGSWIDDPWHMYADNFTGLLACYGVALPYSASQFFPGPVSFTANPVYADLLYNGLLFGGYAIAQRFAPKLVPAPVKA